VSNLTFLQMQNMVLEDAFPEGKRTDAKAWIVDAHTEIWDADNYVFKSTIVPASVVNGLLTAPADLADVFALYDQYGARLRPYYDVAQFYDHYNANVIGQTAIPEAFCVVGLNVAVEPHSAGTVAGFQLAYKKSKPNLVSDTDLSGLPDGYDLALVHGGKAIGFTMINNPFADDFYAKFIAKKQQLRDAYLSGIDQVGDQMPAFRPYAGVG
jgi:hypothetical protein